MKKHTENAQPNLICYGLPTCFLILFSTLCNAQNVGIGISTPISKLHIVGSANATQLTVDAHSTQSNINPLIRLRNSNGEDIMWINSSHKSNVFIGINTGNTSTFAVNNVFMGESAGSLNTGNANTAVGSRSLPKNTTGYKNTSIGWLSLAENNLGFENTSIGGGALYANTNACWNVAIGADALTSQSYTNNNTAWITGNVAIGYRALYANQPTSSTNALNNTAVGSYALTANTIGFENTALGVTALYSNTEGDFNTAIGRQAAFYNTTGSYNTASGYKALRGNAGGNQNTAEGAFSLHNNSGSGNVAVGYQTLFNCTSVQNSVAVGYFAGHGSRDNGDNNTFIGSFAYANADGYTNSTVLGHNTLITASSQVRIGYNVTSIGGPQGWTMVSDGRVKINVREDVPGIAFINLLRPVTYNKSIKLEDELIGRTNTTELLPGNTFETMRHSGFIAQEVEASAKKLGYEFSGVDAPKNSKDIYGLRYADFVVPLVKGMQELSDEVEMLRAENKKLNARLEKLEKLLVTL